MNASPFYGSITALVTPFDEKGQVDVQTFQNLVYWQMKEGTNGFVTAGTTGESPTLFEDEHDILLQACLEVTGGKVPVMAGCGSNNTREAIALTERAQKIGAQGALHITPYYNKPTQEGMYLHFKAIHDATDIPIILYNVPGRTAVDLLPETVARLAELPRIVGIKDATGNLARPLETLRLCGPNFLQFSGNDDTVLPFLAQGGHGCISVVSNVAPKLCAELHKAWREMDVQKAMLINEKLYPLAQALFVESNPTPVKCAMSLLDYGKNVLRLPMTPATQKTRAHVRRAMKDLGLI